MLFWHVPPANVISAFYIRVLVQILTALLPIHISVNVLGKAVNDSLRAWASANLMGGQDGVSGF